MTVTPGVSLWWENKISINILIITFLVCEIRLTSPVGRNNSFNESAKVMTAALVLAGINLDFQVYVVSVLAIFVVKRKKTGCRGVHLVSV